MCSVKIPYLYSHPEQDSQSDAHTLADTQWDILKGTGHCWNLWINQHITAAVLPAPP